MKIKQRVKLRLLACFIIFFVTFVLCLMIEMIVQEERLQILLKWIVAAWVVLKGVQFYIKWNRGDE